jgi:hypothetical protein
MSEYFWCQLSIAFAIRTTREEMRFCRVYGLKCDNDTESMYLMGGEL